MAAARLLNRTSLSACVLGLGAPMGVALCIGGCDDLTILIEADSPTVDSGFQDASFQTMPPTMDASGVPGDAGIDTGSGADAEIDAGGAPGDAGIDTGSGLDAEIDASRPPGDAGVDTGSDADAGIDAAGGPGDAGVDTGVHDAATGFD